MAVTNFLQLSMKVELMTIFMLVGLEMTDAEGCIVHQ